MGKALLSVVVVALIGTLVLPKLESGSLNQAPQAAYRTKEPMLIAGEQQHYSVLPAGTVLYFDRAWPEGHQTFHAYFHFKGDLKAEPGDPEMISPLWLRNVDPEELPKLLKDYPLTKAELVKILKARKITKVELAQLVRDWPDE